jgi:hypothetical protein
LKETIMARSSIFGTEKAPRQAPCHDAEVLGHSDSSDSGSDIQGELHLKTDEFEPLSSEETRGTAPDLVSIDAPQGVGLENLAAGAPGLQIADKPS